MLSKVMYSSKNTDWETPPDLFVQLDDEFNFQLDPCATEQNALCEYFFTAEDDGLVKDWQGLRVFVNPPYGRAVGLWTAKCAEESAKGSLVVALLPARTDTKWWHKDVMDKAHEVHFIEGRLRFRYQGEILDPAPFPSVVVVWDGRMKRPERTVMFGMKVRS